MKILKAALIAIVFVSFASCKDENTVLSAIKDGEELAEGTKVPFFMNQNYPNPFNPSTTIHFRVAQEMKLKLSVYTEDWELVNVLIEKELAMGLYEYNFDARSKDGKALPSGSYYYSLEGGGYVLTMKMTLLK